MLPLNHIVGRVTIYQTLSKGGVVYFVRQPDMSTLFEDVSSGGGRAHLCVSVSVSVPVSSAFHHLIPSRRTTGGPTRH